MDAMMGVLHLSRLTSRWMRHVWCGPIIRQLPSRVRNCFTARILPERPPALYHVIKTEHHQRAVSRASSSIGSFARLGRSAGKLRRAVRYLADDRWKRTVDRWNSSSVPAIPCKTPSPIFRFL